MSNTPPPQRNFQEKLIPVLVKIKQTYIFWYSIYHLVPKNHRYTLALKIDGLFVELVEMTTSASFVKSENKIIYLQTAIRKLDTLKILLLVLWETKLVDNKKYELLSVPLDEIGRMLGGWVGQVEKKNENKNSPTR